MITNDWTWTVGKNTSSKFMSVVLLQVSVQKVMSILNIPKKNISESFFEFKKN